MRPIPDEGLVHRAYRVLQARETDMEEYLREEHTAMIGAARVGMDAARKVWPVDVDHLPAAAKDAWFEAHSLFEQAYEHLDGIAEVFHGELVHRALLGQNITGELLEAEDELKIGPKHEAQAAPPISAEPGGAPIQADA